MRSTLFLDDGLMSVPRFVLQLIEWVARHRSVAVTFRKDVEKRQTLVCTEAG